MIKKLRTLFLSILVLFGLASCIQTNPNTKYSFKDITNHEIADIVNVHISYGPTYSSVDKFSGDYEDAFDVDYILSDMSYNEANTIMENYKYRLFIDFTSNDLKASDIERYVYEYKIYYFSDDSLYESLNKVNYDDFFTSVPPIEEVHTLKLMVMHDYGMHINGELITLLNGYFIWFNPIDYDIDTLVAGDELVIEYTGEFIAQDIYPGSVNAEKMHIQSIEVIEADIVEFKVSAVPGSDELDLVPVDSEYNKFILSNGGYVISQDETFKKYDQYPEGTTLYASLPKSTNSVRVDGLYDYNPRRVSTTEGNMDDAIYAIYPQELTYNGCDYMFVGDTRMQGQYSGDKEASKEEVGDLLGYIIRESDIASFTIEYPNVEYIINNYVLDKGNNNRIPFYKMKAYDDLSYICVSTSYMIFKNLSL